jgi:cytoskeletal protein CcmA (bactofilin family)
LTIKFIYIIILLYNNIFIIVYDLRIKRRNIVFSKNNGANSLTVIGEGVKIEGKISFPGSVRINGTVIGDIISKDVLIIGKEGKVESKVKAKDIVVSGYLKGEITASGLIEITPSGRFIGNLIQEKAMLSIEKGGLFQGKSIVLEKKDLEVKESKSIIQKENHRILKFDRKVA